MHVENALRSRELVEIVNVLGAKEKAVLKCLLEGSESEMAGIGFRSGSNFPAHGIEIPDEMGIAPPGMRRSDFFDSVIAPESTSITKCGNATFGADTSASEDKNAIRGGDCEF